MALPTVTTQAVTVIKPTTAKANGNITDTGNGYCTKRGFVYSLASHGDPGNVAPSASDYENFVQDVGTFDTGSFLIYLSSLAKDTKYYVRAYAYNKSGYSYGGEVDFTTLENIYPDDIFSPRAKANKAGENYDPTKSTMLYAPDVSELDDEVVAIETELGANPKGAKANVKTRLDDVDTDIASKLSKTIAGELAAMTAVIDLQNDDIFLVEDHSVFDVKRKTLWSSIKSVLKTYFDTLYLALAGGTLAGNITFGENTALKLYALLSADGKYCGITQAAIAGEALAFGELCYFSASNGNWYKVDANLSAGYDKVLGICVLAASGTSEPTTMLLYGKVRADSAFPDLGWGIPVYMSEAAGEVVVAQPTTADSCIRVIGFGLSTNELFFCPSPDYIVHV